MKEERFLSKLEKFLKEEEFIEGHEIVDDVTERALLYSLQVVVEVSMDIVAMKVKYMGLKVEDDYSNIEKVVGEGLITEMDGSLLKEMNGIRNAVVHKYDKLDIDVVKEGLGQIESLKDVILKIIE